MEDGGDVLFCALEVLCEECRLTCKVVVDCEIGSVYGYLSPESLHASESLTRCGGACTVGRVGGANQGRPRQHTRTLVMSLYY